MSAIDHVHYRDCASRSMDDLFRGPCDCGADDQCDDPECSECGQGGDEAWAADGDGPEAEGTALRAETPAASLDEAVRTVRDVAEWSRQNGDPLFEDKTLAALDLAAHPLDRTAEEEPHDR